MTTEKNHDAPEQRTPVMIAGVNTVFNRLLAFYLDHSEKYYCAIRCEDAEQARAAICNHPVMLALVEYEIGNGRGPELVKYMRQFNQRMEVAGFSASCCDLKVLRMMDGGVKAFFGNGDQVLDELRMMLGASGDHRYFFNENLSGPLFESWMKMKDDAHAYYKVPFSREELLVASLIYYFGLTHDRADVHLNQKTGYTNKKVEAMKKKTDCKNFLHVLHYMFSLSLIHPAYRDMKKNADGEMKTEFEKLVNF